MNDYEILADLLDRAKIPWTQKKCKPFGIPCVSNQIIIIISQGDYSIDFGFKLDGSLLEVDLYED